MLGVLTFLVLLSVIVAKKLPDDFKICKVGDPNHDVCLKDAIHSAFKQLEKGMPEVDAPPIDPIEVPSAVIDMGTHVITFSGLKIYNLSKLKIRYINSSYTPDNITAYIDLYADEVVAKCDYTIKGQLMVFTVDGGGKAVLTFRELDILVFWTGPSAKRKEYSHYLLSDFDLVFQPKSVSYEFENIMKGNQELSAAVNKVLNENWDVFLNEIKPQLQVVLGKYFLEYANNILKYVPIINA